MSDEYQLQTLLDIRRKDAEDAREAYAREVQAHERLVREAVELEQKRAERASALAAEQDARKIEENAAVDLQAIRTLDEYRRGVEIELRALDDAIEAATERARDQARQVDAAREVLAEKEAALRAVEKHREAWEEARRVERRRKEAARLDEIAARRWREENS